MNIGKTMSAILITVSFMSAFTLRAEESSDALWAHMRDGGLITQEQYQHVVATGFLPGGAAVKDSPVPEKEQAHWNRLKKEKVITSTELAQILLNGSISGLSADENQAFKDLAPVYEPDRAKRLGYELRRKHQKVDLIRSQRREKVRWETRYNDAVERANAAGLPLRVETADGQISEIFAWENGQPLYFTTFNKVAATTISSDKVRPGGSQSFSLTGTNVVVAMWDGGRAVTNHQEFAGGRVWAGVDVSNTASVASHATGVAGTMAAAGLDTNARGIAYAVQVVSYDWKHLGDEIRACVASNDQIHISNHSYGLVCGWDNQNLAFGIWPLWRGDIRLSEVEDYKFGLYQADAQAMDQFCYDAPYHLPIYSAGNDRQEQHYGGYYPGHFVQTNLPTSGLFYYSEVIRQKDGNPSGYDCITPYGVSKNILTVGAVQDLPNGCTNPANVVLEPYSGTGPTDDGRIKPDVVANGQQLYTTYGTAINSYTNVSGTSFASPSVAGSLALIQELHDRIYGTNAPMLSSSLKGVVIHTAQDIGLPGPDYTNGWGLVTTPIIAVSISNNAAWDSLPHIKEVALKNGDAIEFTVTLSTNSSFKTTIGWTDPPGPVQPWALDPTNRVLVNDLDLRVIAPDGATHFPYVLDPLHPANAATRGDNVLDNVEQVVIPNPSNGVYTVRITHKGSLSNGVQDVSILLSGNVATNAPEFIISDIHAAPEVQLNWPGVVGGLYHIEASENLLNTNGWTDQGSISANQELLDWVDADSTNQSVRFYRIKREK